MNTKDHKRGRVAVVGAGPAGMAAALSLHQVGHEVLLFERHADPKPLGSGLNLWPSPIKALGLLGVDVADLGSPCSTARFCKANGRQRAVSRVPESVTREFGAAFHGLLRPQLYERLLSALPAGILRPGLGVKRLEQDETSVRLHLTDGSEHECDVVVGADGIGSVVRTALWGESPIRQHNLQLIMGSTFDTSVGLERRCSVVNHDQHTQASWMSIRHEGRDGYQWWVLFKHDGKKEFTADLRATAMNIARGYDPALSRLIAATDSERILPWQIKDRKPLAHWSRGRVTLIGDAAHPVSPYSAYGAGMAIEDGYFLGRRLAGVDLTNYNAVRSALDAFEEPRRPHTTRQVQAAYVLGQVFHHLPTPLAWLRDLVLDHTGLLQKTWAGSIPADIYRQVAEIDDVERAVTIQS